MSASSAWPCLVLRRYFLSQMSTDAGCIGMSCFVSVATASSLAVLMFVCAPVLVPVRRCRLRVVPAHRRGGDDAAARARHAARNRIGLPAPPSPRLPGADLSSPASAAKHKAWAYLANPTTRCSGDAGIDLSQPPG